MKTWNFGIVGAGLIADFHARAIGDMPNAKLVAVCDAISERAGKLAEKYGCKAFADSDDLIAKGGVDVITIATPSGAHMAPAIAAAKAGKHVVCEKPMEITLERIDKMIEAHEQAGTQLGCIFQTRFNDAYAAIRQAVQQGRFGKLTYAGAYVPWWRKDDYYNDSWHGTWKLDGGGALMNQSIHPIDLLCELMWPVESVQAFTSNLGHEQMETEATAAAALKFKNGALGVIYGTTASYPGQLMRLEISGTKGTAIYTNGTITAWQFAEESNQDEQIRRKFAASDGSGASSDPAAIDYSGHTRNFGAFVESLETGEPYCLSGAEARKSVGLILAIYESAREHRPVMMG